MVIINILVVIMVTVSVWAMASLFRLNKFSRFMKREIDRVYAARIGGNRAELWPDVSKCYDNLKWYNPFDYNFQRMMVYDRTR